MALQLDIMSQSYDPGEVDFTVDSAVLEVAVNPVVTPKIFANVNGGVFFVAGDNVLLQKIWSNIAFGFGQGNGSHSMNLFWMDQVGGLVAIPELANGSGVFIPTLCGDIALPGDGLSIKVPLVDSLYRLVLVSMALNVSMVSVPTVLDTEVIPVQYYLQIKHMKVLT